MILKNILGFVALKEIQGAFILVGNESSLRLSREGWGLIPPSSGETVFSFSDISVHDAGDRALSVIRSGRTVLEVQGVFKGGQEKYWVVSSRDEHEKFYGRVLSWAGDELFRFPHVGFIYAMSELVAVEFLEGWHVYDLQGNVVLNVEPPQGLGRAGICHFTDRLFFFRSGGAGVGEYQVYDTHSRRFLAVLELDAALLGALQLPDGSVLAVDCGSIYRLSVEQGGVELKRLYSFVVQLDYSVHDLNLWHDEGRVYVAVGGACETQNLYSCALNDLASVEVVSWSGEWVVCDGRWAQWYGCIGGLNYCLLRRAGLLGDSAVLVWSQDQPLNDAVLTPDFSSSVVVSQVPSATKGKHSYSIVVEDEIVSRAIRAATNEIGRLLVESCAGPYNRAPSVQDRKFDGEFQIEIRSSQQPSEYEREYVAEYIEHYRYWGGLSPAGSRGGLKPPRVVWTDLR